MKQGLESRVIMIMESDTNRQPPLVMCSAVEQRLAIIIGGILFIFRESWVHFTVYAQCDAILVRVQTGKVATNIIQLAK